MKKRNAIKLLIGNLALVTMVSGCAAASEHEMLQMINNGDQIEIEVAMPTNVEAEQGTERAVEWTELASLESNKALRDSWDDVLMITSTETGKNGVLYVDGTGVNVNNNTLQVALHNRAFAKMFESEDGIAKLAEGALANYADLDVEDEYKAAIMGVNGYFNLLPDADANYCNADSTITRLDFLAMIMRAETPVSEIIADSAFETAVGANDLNVYAQEVVEYSYLDIESKSLNNMTANGTISRAEVIYTIVSRYFADELASVDTKSVKFSDCIDGGNIAAEQKFIEDATSKDYWKSYELTYALANPDGGCPSDLYKALVVAHNVGILDSTETRWDEAVTRSEAIEFIINANLKDDSIESFNYQQGEISGYEVEDETETQENINDIGNQVYQDGDEVVEEPVVQVHQPEIKEGTVATLNFSDQDIEYYCNKFNLTREELLSMLIKDFDALREQHRNSGGGNSGGNSGGNNSGGNESGGNNGGNDNPHNEGGSTREPMPVDPDAPEGSM